MNRNNPTSLLIVVALFCGSLLLVQAQAQTAVHAAALQTMEDINRFLPGPMAIDADKVAANGLRVLSGRHVTVYTDAPSSRSIDELVDVFDAAVPKWCAYFEVPETRAKPWKLQAFVMRDKLRFERAGLIPRNLPEFPAGLNQGSEIWLFVQPDDYYTRHLFLHEGTHAFMAWFNNGLGAPWFAEGMAELLGLHRWADGQLSINQKIEDATESEGWGRPKLIKDWIEANSDGAKTKSLQDVLLTPNKAFRDVENYAWAWAACEFFGKHPLTRAHFQKWQQEVDRSARRFNARVESSLGDDRPALERDWALFIRELDYGYDVARSAMSKLNENNGSFVLDSDRSWQFMTAFVKSGETYRVTASGRFQIGSSRLPKTAASEAAVKPWPCEANGITIEYFRGRPIGELQAMIVPSQIDASFLPSLCRSEPVPIGSSGQITVDVDGLLCLRVNESPSNLADNVGTLKIAIEKVDE